MRAVCSSCSVEDVKGNVGLVRKRQDFGYCVVFGTETVMYLGDFSCLVNGISCALRPAACARAFGREEWILFRLTQPAATGWAFLLRPAERHKR